jgi:hypothetical protein
VTLVWFSAMLRFVILVADEGATDLSRSVVVFRAEDFSDAKQRALDLGRTMESTYQGGTGQEVRWRLEAVETLDLLGDAITDGREVYSEPMERPAGRTIPFDAEFDPSNTAPGQSGV